MATILEEHPFFQGTSQSLRERLAPLILHRKTEQVSSEVLRQGEEPHGSTDYLFLSAPDFPSSIEVLLEDRSVAVLGSGAVFGQEAILGLTKAFMFGIRVPVEAVQSLSVVPRKALEGLLEVYKDDALLLTERAHASAVSILRTWYLHPVSHIKLRLFDNAEHAFKHRLVQAVQIKLFAAGSFLCHEQESWTNVFCIFRGEAHVTIDGQRIAKLAHVPGMNAWAAWWGTLEVLGICDKCPASVFAVTDCIAWELSRKGLADLRANFPKECRLFDKVAVEHLKQLHCHGIKIHQSSLARQCDSRFLKELDLRAESRIYKQGEIVMREGDRTDTDIIYVILRGCVEVSKHVAGFDEQDAIERCVIVASLTEGDWFGEVAALGISETRTATVMCSTICDIRVLTRDAILNALERFPDQTGPLEALAEQRGYRQPEAETQKKLTGLPFFLPFSLQFLEMLGSEMTNFAAFTQQHIIDQNEEAKAMLVLLQGKVAILIDEAVVHEIKAPCVVGESALVDPGAKSFFTVRSQCLCHFRCITTANAESILEKFPEDFEKLKELASENLETLRSVLARKFHGKNLKAIALKQAKGIEDAGGEDMAQVPQWWTQSLFKDSDPRFLEFLSERMGRWIYFPREVMISEGDEEDYALIIQLGEGYVEVGNMRVGEVKPGSLIGEAVLLGSAKTRTASVRAVGLVSVCVLARSVLLEALDHFPSEMDRVEELTNLRANANKILQGVPGAAGASFANSLYQSHRGTASAVFGGLLGGGNSVSSGNRRGSHVASPRGHSNRRQSQSVPSNGQDKGGHDSPDLTKEETRKRWSNSPQPDLKQPFPNRRCSTMGDLSEGSRSSVTGTGKKKASASTADVMSHADTNAGADSMHRSQSLKVEFATESRDASEESKQMRPAPSLPSSSRKANATRRNTAFAAVAATFKKVKVVEDAITAVTAVGVHRAPPAPICSTDSVTHSDTIESIDTLATPNAAPRLDLDPPHIVFPSEDGSDGGSSQSSGLESASPMSRKESEVSPVSRKDSEVSPTSRKETEAEQEDWRSSMIQKAFLKKPVSLKDKSFQLEPDPEYTRSPVPDGNDDSSSESGNSSACGSRASEVSRASATSISESEMLQDHAFAELLRPPDEPKPLKTRETCEQWARRRHLAIETAPMRQACRMARKGMYLPLVPSSRGFVERLPKVHLQPTPLAQIDSRNFHTSRAMLKAHGVYLQRKRFDDQRSVVRSGWKGQGSYAM